MFIKKFILFTLTFIVFCHACYADETIKAKNNAYIHNNKGLLYLQDNYYYGAIREFQIAIDLNPKSQASAVFYTNLGKTYEKLEFYDLAKPCFEKALSLNALCFEYYVNLAENYKHLGIVDTKLNEFIKNKKSPFDDILIGLLYIKKEDYTTGVAILDEFANSEYKLTVSKGIMKYIEDNFVYEEE